MAVTILLIAACTNAVTVAPSAPAVSAQPSAIASATPSLSGSLAPTPIAVSPGEPWIAYVGGIDDVHVGIRLVRPDGSGDHAAVPDMSLPTAVDGEGGWQNFPDWAPDGQRLAFSADEGGTDRDTWTRDLWIAEVGQPGGVKVLDCVSPCADYSYPAWSPDGKTIAYTTLDVADEIADGSRLMALDVESGTTRELSATQGPEYILQPRWSPDGRSLVIAIDRWSDTGPTSVQTGTAIAIVDLDADSPAPRRLTEWDLWANYPDWHPTDDLIVFSTRPWTALDEGPSNLSTIRPDGSALTALTRFTAPVDRAVQPSWTPNGDSIIFTKVVGTGFGEPTMAMVDADGNNLRSATGGPFQFGTHARLRPTP